MNKDVIINVRGNQMDGVTQEQNAIELITEGKYYKKGDNYYITYKESEVTGMEGTTTTLKVSKDVVTLMRFGKINSQFVFQRGQRHQSFYDTEFGSFNIGVYADKVEIKMNENGGEIRVGYEMEIDNHSSGRNDFHMFIREAGSSNEKHIGGHTQAN